MGILRETVSEFFDRKQHWLFLLITATALVAMLLGVTKKSELIINKLETQAALYQFGSDSLNLFIAFMVLVAVASTVSTFSRMSKKGRVEFYLSKPITRNSLFFNKLISIYVVFAVTICAMGIIAAAELFALGALPPLNAVYILVINLAILAVWMSVTSFVGIYTKSVSYSLAVAVILWSGQLVLKGRSGWSIEQPLIRYLIDSVYYLLPNTAEIGEIGIQISSGVAVTNWLPCFTSLALAVLLIYSGSRIFNNRDF